MIVSFRHNFAFTAIPKTGTHAVRRALREELGPEDIEQVALFVEKKFPMPELAKLKHGHISLLQLQGSLPEEQFESLFKFAFVRNPFDRFISYCSFMTRTGGEFLAQPHQVMAHYLRNPPKGHVLFWPQSYFVCDSQGKPLSNYVGRVEKMQQSYDEIAKRVGIPSAPLEKVNATSRAGYQSYYTPPLKDAVARLYAQDLKLFEYEF